jgi:DNA-binding NarL/FixJ family response regulator
MPIKLAIFEDNARLRQSLELLLEEGSGFQITGSFPSCDHALEDIQKSFPDLVIMDIDMPGVNGIEGVKTIKSSFPEIKVVMYTVFDDDQRIFDCICAGANGYLLKNTSPIKLIQSLHELKEGGTPMSPFVAQKVFEFFRKKESPNTEDYKLTNREKEILVLLVKGNSYKMIADKSHISIDTVKKHLANIYNKLHVHCGTEAVAKALQQKIVIIE